jgi:hypothetical protein
VVHRRELAFNKQQDLVVVRDLVGGSGRHLVALHFHFDPGAEVEVCGDCVVILAGAEVVTFELDSRLEKRLHRGSDEPLAGWFSPAFGRKVPAFELRATGSFELPIQLESRIRVHASGGEPSE